MNSSSFSHVTDELLSAYLDNALPPDQRAMIDEAVARDEDVAWRLHTLRYTVELVRQLPDIPLPQQFTLSEAQVEQPIPTTAASEMRRPGAASSAGSGFWDRIADFVRGGSAVWRNAAAACATLLLVLLFGSGLTRVNHLAETTPGDSASVIAPAQSARQQLELAADTRDAPAAEQAAAPTILAAPGALNQRALEPPADDTDRARDGSSTAESDPPSIIYRSQPSAAGESSLRRSSPPPPPAAREPGIAAAALAPADTGSEAMDASPAEGADAESAAAASVDETGSDSSGEDMVTAAGVQEAPQAIALASEAQSSEPAPDRAAAADEVQPPPSAAPASAAAAAAAEEPGPSDQAQTKQDAEPAGDADTDDALSTAVIPASDASEEQPFDGEAPAVAVYSAEETGTLGTGTAQRPADQSSAGQVEAGTVAAVPLAVDGEGLPAAGSVEQERAATPWLLYAQILLALLLIVFLLLWLISARAAASA